MRKSSVSHQLTRTARRLSTAIAPQLTKIETVSVLQRYNRLRIRITNIAKLQEAIKQYVLHNGKIFEPVEFEIVTDENIAILSAQFSTDDVVLFEGQKRLLSICLHDPTEGELYARFSSENAPQTQILAKVRHPLSGIKLFEVTQNSRNAKAESWVVTAATEEITKCQVCTHSNPWRHMLNVCGFLFAPEWWSIVVGGKKVGQIVPQKSICEENSLYLTWNDDVDNELRVIIICVGLIQTIKESFPSLMQIVCECRQRKMNILP